MRIAITGHTSGIGKCAYTRLTPNIIGFSRSNGYNINNPLDRQRIINESNNCDIFINNAAAGFGQTELFIELFKEWQTQDKLIINVGSRIAEIKSLPAHRYELLHYQASKLILKEMSTKVIGRCKVKYKWFGYVGTENILKKYPHFTANDYITEDQAVDIILS
jgi:short-subunit dehydrogenase